MPADSYRPRSDTAPPAPLAHRGGRGDGGEGSSIAMKIYDYQWSATYGMEPAEAADELVRDGVDTALIRNQLDPLPGSGVDQAAYLSTGAPLTVESDWAWSEALRAAGLRVYQTTALFFDPELL